MLCFWGSFINQWTFELLLLLAFMSNDDIHVVLWGMCFHFLCGLSGSYGNCMLNILKIYGFSKRWHNTAGSAATWEGFGFFIFFQLLLLSRYVTVILICISLKTNNVENFYLHILDMCASSLKKCLLKSFINLL